MTSNANVTSHTALETALRDVYVTLKELLAAADEQYAAIAAGDHRRLENVTSRQERLSAQLERHERNRLTLLAGRPLRQAINELPRDHARRAGLLNEAVARAVRELQQRHARTKSLLERTIELTGQTLDFVQRLVTPQPAAYGRNGLARATHSMLVDSRA